MFIFYANKNLLTVHQKEPITSGSANTYRVQFEFSPDWDGLSRTAFLDRRPKQRAARRRGRRIPDAQRRFHPLDRGRGPDSGPLLFCL